MVQMVVAEGDGQVHFAWKIYFWYCSDAGAEMECIRHLV
jgi:hypothetical protein